MEKVAVNLPFTNTNIPLLPLIDAYLYMRLRPYGILELYTRTTDGRTAKSKTYDVTNTTPQLLVEL
jgi:hypothetical protein